MLDPVMITATGHRLIDEDAVAAITADLLPRATVVTPRVERFGSCDRPNHSNAIERSEFCQISAKTHVHLAEI